MKQITVENYNGYRILITKAEEDDEYEVGFGFEIYEYDEDTNLPKEIPFFESYGSCEFDTQEEAIEAAKDYIYDLIEDI